MSTGAINPNVSNQPSALTRTMFPGDYAAADEGSYFSNWLGATASGANAVTTQALGLANPLVVVHNKNPAGGYNIYMRSIKLRTTTAVTGTTSVYHAGSLNPNIGTLTATGTVLTGPNNVNSASGNTSLAGVYGGVITATAQASAPGSRIVHTGPVAGVIPIVLDSWLFAYGEPVNASIALQEATTTTKIIGVSLPPVIIAPQWFYIFAVWGPSWQAAAASYTYDVCYIERPSGQ